MAHVDPMIQAILKADHLSEDARFSYSKRLALSARAARNKGLHLVLALHAQVLNWIFRSFTEAGTPRTMP